MVLTLLVLGQLTPAPNLNLWPIDARDEGARLSKWRAYALDCRGAGIVCTSDGGVLVATVSGGGGGSTPTVTCAADQALSWDGANWLCVSKVSAAFAADASVTAQALAADPAACGAGQYASDISAAGALTCSTPPGTYVLPDATGAVTGGIRLTGDLGGTATSPSVVDDSHAHTGTTISALDTSDITTGTLPQARGGTGAGALTCVAGDFITSNGTAYSCATPAGGGGGYATVQDEGTGLTARTVLNFAGAGVACVDDTTRTTCTISGGGGGSPGGSTTQVQYNNAGAFGGISQVQSDGTDLVMVGSTTHGTTPAATKMLLEAFQHAGASGPSLPHVTAPELTFDVNLHGVAFVRSDEAWWGCTIPAAHGNATYTPSGRSLAGTATGTAATVAWAATDARTRMAWVQHPAAATANTNAGYRAAAAMVWRGSTAGVGGWYWHGSFALPLVTATTRVFVGLRATPGTVLTATADPNAALNTVYVGANAADANLSICSNDATTTATCTTLGASFPAHTNNKAYDVAFWAAPFGSTIGYWIRDVVVGTEATGSISTDLPLNTVQLGWDFNVNTGGTASAVQIHVGGSCWWANP